MSADDEPTPAQRDADLKGPGQSSEDRDRAADTRDQTSEAHENAADARDDRADARDDTAETRDRDADDVDVAGAADRAEAQRDRRGAARDRAHAASDREASWSDRTVAAGERVISSIDGLTGLHRRDAGILELEREISRAKRTGQPFVLAFVDVDGLKAKNDALGHAAGDELLRHLAETIRAHLRPYDLIVRFGGDEFVCGLLDLQIEEVAERFRLVNADLVETQQASVTIGLAQLKEDDSLEALIERADQALYRQRQKRG